MVKLNPNKRMWNKIVKIHPSRGYKGMFKVTKEKENSYILKPIQGNQIYEIYKAHCYQDQECIREYMKSKTREF
jgi:hypothetical protein